MENNGLAYRMEGSVFLPRIDISDRQIDPGKYGWMRVQWLLKNYPSILDHMKMMGQYGKKNAEFNEQAMAMERKLVAKMAEKRMAEMPDKKTRPVDWAAWMNAIKAQAEEIVRTEMVEVKPTFPECRL